MRSFKALLTSLTNRSLSVLVDYPWLWAIRREWKDWSREYRQLNPRVSRKMEDLRLVLLQDSEKSPFKLWVFLNANGNLRVECIEPHKEYDWARVIAVHIDPKFTDIVNLVMELPCQSGCDWPSEITIFEHPNKSSLNEVLQTIFTLQGSKPYYWA